MANKMDVDVEKIQVMASTNATGSVSVSLHTLVIMNISEHWTRVKAQAGEQERVIGALIGKQKGRNIEVMNSFELLFHPFDDGSIVIDKEYYLMKESQFKQVFTNMDFLGWYTTGELPSETDMKIHQQICEIYESPILIKLNPNSKISELPLSAFESVIDVVGGKAMPLFVELKYTLATEEAERIGVDHIAHMSTPETGEVSLVTEHLLAQSNAIRMLHSRVKVILEYVKLMQTGEEAMNHEILRDTYTLCHMLPVLNLTKFNEEFHDQCNDVSLMTFLGVMSKSCNTINTFVNKFNLLYDRQGMGRLLRGLLF